jgi:hypothetical protein
VRTVVRPDGTVSAVSSGFTGAAARCESHLDCWTLTLYVVDVVRVVVPIV